MKQKHIMPKHNRSGGTDKPKHIFQEHKEKYPKGNSIHPDQNPLTGGMPSSGGISGIGGGSVISQPDQADQGEVNL